MNKIIPFLLLAATACTSSLDPATLIARDRVLGAKVTVDTDPSRAWPALGENATITWLTASPGDTPDFSWTFAACPAATTAGLPICDGPVFAYAESSGPVPTLAVTVPSDMEARSIVVLGAICASGSPVIDPQTFQASCDDGSHADLVSQHIFLAHGDETNHHPDLAGASFVLDGAAWEAGDCPEIAAGTENIVLGAEVAGTARETFTVDGAAWREELQLSPFATAGELDRRYAYIEADDDRPASLVAVEWTAPGADEVPAEGLRVTFNFVIRDMRGGVDAATRTLCVR